MTLNRLNATTDLDATNPSGRTALLPRPRAKERRGRLSRSAAIRKGMRIAADHPGAKRPAEKMDPAFREWLIPFGDSGYIVLYRVEGDLAVMLAVRHQHEAGYS